MKTIEIPALAELAELAFNLKIDNRQLTANKETNQLKHLLEGNVYYKKEK